MKSTGHCAIGTYALVSPYLESGFMSTMMQKAYFWIRKTVLDCINEKA
jgi:hypothetical protein